MIVFGVSRISFNVEILDVLPKSLDNVQALKSYREHFAPPDKLVMTVSSDDAERTEAAVEELIEGLSDQQLIGDARWQTGLEEDVEAGAEMLAYLWLNSEPEVFSGFARTLKTEAARKAKLEAQLERLAEPMMGGDAESFALQYDPYGLLAHPFVQQLMGGEGASGDRFSSKDGTFRVVLADLPQTFDGYPEMKAWLEDVQRAVEEMRMANGWEDVVVSYTGEPPYVVEISGMMEGDMSSSMGWTIAIVVLLFWIMQRRVMPLVILALALGVVFGLTLAVGGLVYGHLNIMSIGFAAILVGLAADYGVLISQYQRAFHRDVRSIRKALMPSILWAATTTAAVFFALNFSQFPGVAQLGTLVAAGILAGALVMLTIYADVIGWIGRRFGKESKTETPISEPAPTAVGMVIRNGRWMTGVISVATVIVLLAQGLPGVDYRLRSMEDMPLESMRAFMEIREKVESWSQDHLPLVVDAPSLDDARVCLEEVAKTAASLEDDGVLKDFVVPLAVWPAPHRQQANREALQGILDGWDDAKRDADEAGFTDEALALAEQVVGYWQRWADADQAYAVPSSAVARDSLRRFVVFEDGSYAALCLVTPTDYEAAKADDFSELNVLNTENAHVAAWQSLRVAIRRLLIHDATYVLLPLSGVLCVMLIIVFRNVKDVLLSATAIFVAGLLLNAFMSMTGQQWNFQSLAAVPVLLGTGLDFVIHVVLALRRYDNDISSYWQGTGKAVVFCGFTTATGFGSLAFATDPGLAQLGLVSSAGILTMMAVAVFLLPGWRRQAMGR